MPRNDVRANFIKDVTPVTLKNLNPNHCQEVYEVEGNCFLFSRVQKLERNDWETLVFQSTEDGDILDYKHEYGMIGYYPMREVVENFLETLTYNGHADPGTD